MFVRDCGATTDFSTIISLHGSSSSFKEQDHFVFVIKGRAKIELLWTGPRQLSVKCPTCQAGDIYKQLDQFTRPVYSTSLKDSRLDIYWLKMGRPIKIKNTEETTKFALRAASPFSFPLPVRAHWADLEADALVIRRV